MTHDTIWAAVFSLVGVVITVYLQFQAKQREEKIEREKLAQSDTKISAELHLHNMEFAVETVPAVLTDLVKTLTAENARLRSALSECENSRKLVLK